MAEGDSIRRLAGRLGASFAGRVAEAASARAFAGDRLLEVAPVGKHLLMRFAGGLTVHSHLRMQGAWRQHRPGWRPSPRTLRPVMWFDFGPAGVLAAHDMPVLEILATTDEHRVVGHLGPDILAADWPSRLPAAAAAVRAQPARMIRSALLDQRNLCGIGNLWAVEGLFIAGVWPHAPAGDVDTGKLLELVGRMMRLGLRQGTQSTTGNLRKGETHWVYGRYRRPCRRCGTPVAFTAAGADPYERETWWCPYCQPAV
ncbi:DNA-formamidopyrimidine glycosylase family protein [Actinoplanes sp. RD1]|uniref:DNA-formamidopyrimidine glycosylase family protein n=1 Tax=Actinoplanes sp. RD1 TaxID=3064538 RepID=UPI0027415226|nr:DNA-formamidopyrimidine glycosylase family protein [Actinoplanes sp. RD1]